MKESGRETGLMVKAFTRAVMGALTKEDGSTINSMAKVLRLGLTVLIMKEII